MANSEANFGKYHTKIESAVAEGRTLIEFMTILFLPKNSINYFVQYIRKLERRGECI